MKLVLVLLAVFVLWLLLRGSLRRMRGGAAQRGAPNDGAPQPMLACAQCGVHLPRDEALPGRGGVFCGEGHRSAYERQHPAP